MCAALPSSSPSKRAKSIECCGPSRSTGDDDDGDGGEEEETEVAAALLYEGGIAVVPEERRPQHMETEGPGRILESEWGHMRRQIYEMTIEGLDMTGDPFLGRVAVASPPSPMWGGRAFLICQARLRTSVEPASLRRG